MVKAVKVKKGVRKTSERGQTRFNLKDPYMPKSGWQEPTLCSKCGAVFSGKQWSLDKKLIEKAKKDPCLQYAKCPGCKKVEDRYAMGILHLKGDYFKGHKDAIINALKSEGKRATYKNPLERLISINEEKNITIVEMTNDQLALRLSRFLHKTFHGDLKIQFDPGQKFLRVYWER